MQFLKTLFWVVLTAVLVIFGSRNWVTVEHIKLWGGLETDMKLPVLILIGFLAGFLPQFLIHKLSVWRYRRTTDSLQRALEEARAQLNPPSQAGADGAQGAQSPAGPQPSLL